MGWFDNIVSGIVDMLDGPDRPAPSRPTARPAQGSGWHPRGGSRNMQQGHAHGKSRSAGSQSHGTPHRGPAPQTGVALPYVPSEYTPVAQQRGFFADPNSLTGFSYSNGHGGIARSANPTHQYHRMLESPVPWRPAPRQEEFEEGGPFVKLPHYPFGKVDLPDYHTGFQHGPREQGIINNLPTAAPAPYRPSMHPRAVAESMPFFGQFF